MLQHFFLAKKLNLNQGQNDISMCGLWVRSLVQSVHHTFRWTGWQRGWQGSSRGDWGGQRGVGGCYIGGLVNQRQFCGLFSFNWKISAITRINIEITKKIFSEISRVIPGENPILTFDMYVSICTIIVIKHYCGWVCSRHNIMLGQHLLFWPIVKTS